MPPFYFPPGERFAIGEITADIYTKFATKAKAEMAEIEQEMNNFNFELSNPEKVIDFLLELRSNPSLMWASGDFYHKQRYQELIYPKGIWFDAENNIYRTKEINSAFLIKPTGTRAPDDNEKGTPHQTDEKSPLVPPSRPNMNELLEDTRDFARIWDLYGHLLKEA